MTDPNEFLDRGIELLREPVDLGDGLDARVLRAIAALPTPTRPGPLRRAGTWLVRPRRIHVRPVLPLAAAAALAIAAVGLRDRAADTAATPSAATPSEIASVRFVLTAPAATAVSLVGDFNDWVADSTPMVSAVADGLWTVTVPLRPGRYRYAFLVNGATWLPDPDAPRAFDDDFGRPNSVLTIGGT